MREGGGGEEGRERQSRRSIDARSMAEERKEEETIRFRLLSLLLAPFPPRWCVSFALQGSSRVLSPRRRGQKLQKSPPRCRREGRRREEKKNQTPLPLGPERYHRAHLRAPRRRSRGVLRQRERLQGPQRPPCGLPGRGGGVQQLLERGRGPVAGATAAAAESAAAAEASPDAPSRPHGRERLQVGIRGRVRVGEAAREERVEEGGAHFLCWKKNAFPFKVLGGRGRGFLARLFSPLSLCLSLSLSLASSLLLPSRRIRERRKGALSLALVKGRRGEREEGEERFPLRRSLL